MSGVESNWFLIDPVIESRISEFKIGDRITSIEDNDYITNCEIIGIEKCNVKGHVYCEICNTKIKLKMGDNSLWYCPISGNGRILFKIEKLKDFITEKEFKI